MTWSCGCRWVGRSQLEGSVGKESEQELWRHPTNMTMPKLPSSRDQHYFQPLFETMCRHLWARAQIRGLIIAGCLSFSSHQTSILFRLSKSLIVVYDVEIFNYFDLPRHVEVGRFEL